MNTIGWGMLLFIILPPFIYGALLLAFGYGFYEYEHTCEKCQHILPSRKKYKEHVANCKGRGNNRKESLKAA